MSKANEALKAKQFAAAVAAFGRALALRPGHFDARAKRITALLGKGDSDQALSEAKQLSADSPDNAVAWGLLGDALQRKGEIEKTLAAYSRAIEIDPKYAGAFNARGTLRRDRGELDAALADLDQAVALASGNTVVLTNRGIALERKGQWDRALADYDRVLLIDPANARVKKLKEVLLTLRTRQGQGVVTPPQAPPVLSMQASPAPTIRAIPTVPTAPSASPAQPEILKAVGLLQQRKLDQAIAALDVAVARIPNRPWHCD